MKITAENDRCLSVELTGDDMRKLDITYEALDYANIETRRVLWTLLDEARRALGKSISLSDRLIIETTPVQQGGCRFVFTSVPEAGGGEKHLRLITRSGTLVWEFADANALLAFREKTVLPGDCRVAVYYKDGRFRAIASPAACAWETLLAAAEEFGRVLSMDEEKIAEMKERWQPVCQTLPLCQAVN